MNGPRRRLLVATGSLLAGLAGCLSTYSGEVPESETDDATTKPTRTTEPASDYPATVNATTTVEREEIEYVEEDDTVRYVAAYRHTNHDEVENGSKPEREPVHETVPFEEWAETECAHVGAKLVSEAMRDRLDGEAEGVSAGVTTEDGEKVVVVAHRTILNRDGEVVSEPVASYDRVKRVAPERAAVTLSLAGRTHSCVVRAKTRKQELHQD